MLLFTLPAGLTALCLATLVHAAANVCYHPNGSPSDDVPCNPASPYSMCCSSPNACLASGLCKSVSTNGTSADTDKFIRATCTDMTWASDVCPPYCMPNSSSSNDTAFNLNLSQNDVHIRQCHERNQTFGLAARFCCGFADEKARCCDMPQAFFELNVVSSSADTPVALNPADGSPKSWTPLSPPPPGSSTSCSTSSFATPKTPLVATPSSASSDTSSSKQPTTADAGTSDSSVPSTNPPSAVSSPTASATSTSASSQATSPTTAAAASAVATALADSTSASSGSNSAWGNSGKSANSNSDSDSWSYNKSSPRLSTGAVVGIGLGASMAAAGLVTISVYFLARRRLYMKQKRKWEEQMKAAGAGAGGAPGPGMVAVQTQTADGKPAMVMLAGGQGPMLQLADGRMWDGEGPLLSSLPDLKKAAGWETRSLSDFSELEDSKRLSGSTTRSDGAATTQEGAAKKPVDPRGGRTITWFARHSIYEMG